MLAYRVHDMTCGHCASAITKAIRDVDPGAKVAVDLAQHLVRIDAAESTAAGLREAIAEAGYTPLPLRTEEAAAPAPHTGGCCCGGSTSKRGT
jgi:copper chaperone